MRVTELPKQIVALEEEVTVGSGVTVTGIVTVEKQEPSGNHLLPVTV